jgi:hypothetical protein
VHHSDQVKSPIASTSTTPAHGSGGFGGRNNDVLADLETHDWVERPTIAKPRDSFVYYLGGSPVPFSAAPKVYNRAFSITADV